LWAGQPRLFTTWAVATPWQRRGRESSTRRRRTDWRSFPRAMKRSSFGLIRPRSINGEMGLLHRPSVHVEIYTPHESKLGSRLLLRVEVLVEYTEQFDGTPWLLLTIEAHILTKMAAILDRHASAKGEKDARELLALLRLDGTGISPEKAAQIAIRAANATEAANALKPHLSATAISRSFPSSRGSPRRVGGRSPRG